MKEYDEPLDEWQAQYPQTDRRVRKNKAANKSENKGKQSNL